MRSLILTLGLLSLATTLFAGSNNSVGAPTGTPSENGLQESSPKTLSRLEVASDGAGQRIVIRPLGTPSSQIRVFDLRAHTAYELVSNLSHVVYTDTTISFDGTEVFAVRRDMLESSPERVVAIKIDSGLERTIATGSRKMLGGQDTSDGRQLYFLRDYYDFVEPQASSHRAFDMTPKASSLQVVCKVDRSSGLITSVGSIAFLNASSLTVTPTMLRVSADRALLDDGPRRHFPCGEAEGSPIPLLQQAAAQEPTEVEPITIFSRPRAAFYYDYVQDLTNLPLKPGERLRIERAESLPANRVDPPRSDHLCDPVLEDGQQRGVASGSQRQTVRSRDGVWRLHVVACRERILSSNYPSTYVWRVNEGSQELFDLRLFRKSRNSIAVPASGDSRWR